MTSPTGSHLNCGALSRHSGCRVNLVRAGSLQPLLLYLREASVPAEDLLESSGIPTTLSDEPDGFVPLNSVHSLVERAARVLDRPDLGAVVAARTSAFQVAFLGPALRRAVTIYDYLQIGVQLIGQVTSCERFWMTLEKDLVRFHHQAPGRPCEGRTHADTFCMAVTVMALREALGPSWSPIEMDVTATDVRTLGELDVFGDASLRLGQPHSSFTMPLASLQQRMPIRRDADRAASPDTIRIEPALPQTLVEDIQALTDSLLSANCLKLDAVAEAAGMSTRTLQRRLRERGLTYLNIVNRSRVQLASELLLHTNMQIREIAAALGYTDPPNFTRAFRRTTGISPQRFRDCH